MVATLIVTVAAFLGAFLCRRALLSLALMGLFLIFVLGVASVLSPVIVLRLAILILGFQVRVFRAFVLVVSPLSCWGVASTLTVRPLHTRPFLVVHGPHDGARAQDCAEHTSAGMHGSGLCQHETRGTVFSHV